MIFPLFVKDTLTSPEGDEISRTILLPLYFRKSVEKEGVKQPGTFFVFPFGGVIRNFYGRDRIVVVVWPLYVKQERPEATSWSVLHPIFTHVRWKDGGRGWKMWPLFGINRAAGPHAPIVRSLADLPRSVGEDRPRRIPAPVDIPVLRKDQRAGRA